MRVACTELQPWAMLANGPPWMIAGVFSRVCTRLGMKASLSSAAMAPETLQVLGGDLAAPQGGAHDDAVQPGLQVFDVGGQAQDGHDLRGHGDVVAGLALDALAALRDGDLAERPVVQVDHARPGDVVGIDLEVVALEEMVVEHGRAEVVRRADGVDVAGEVQVDVFHGDDLRVAAAGRAALDPEARAQRGLAQGGDGLLADLVQGHGETHVGGGLALAGRGGGDGGAEHQLAVRLVLQPLEHVQVDLGLVATVGVDLVGLQTQTGGHVHDRKGAGFAGDLDVALHGPLDSIAFG